MADGAGHGTQAPVGGVGRGCFQGTANHLSDVVIADAPGRSGPWLVVEAVEPLCGETSLPLAEGVGVDAEALHNGFVFKSLCCRQDDTRPPCQSLAKKGKPNMQADSIYFKGHLCFRREWSGFDTIKPINVIIGRNNSGKSHLLDLVEALSEGNLNNRGWEYKCCGILDESSLKRFFTDSGRSTDLGRAGYDDWRAHGIYFLDVRISWEITETGNIRNLEFPPDFEPQRSYGGDSTENRLKRIRTIASTPTHQLNGKVFRKLAADRDIKAEIASNNIELYPDGSGATNIIRRYKNSVDERFNRDAINLDLRSALNNIFGHDGQFAEIIVQEHDMEDPTRWEIYLNEPSKGLISLSASGSGLKTVFLVLLNLVIVPKVEKKETSEFVFAFEELENNLHPALLRRMFQYLEEYAVREQSTIFLTTHSSTALDIFGMSDNAQIIHVSHDWMGNTSKTKTISAHFDRLGVVSELGARPSDLLQSNGIVWVEGPSDRIYINHWIQLYSDGSLREGRDYQCAFYGGALLAQVEFKSTEEQTELTNLLQINPNIIVVCDGDRDNDKSRIKGRAKRIRSEVKKIPNGHIWITEAREIENYIPGSVLEKVFKSGKLPDPSQYESFFPRKTASGKSYLELRMCKRLYRQNNPCQ